MANQLTGHWVSLVKAYQSFCGRVSLYNIHLTISEAVNLELVNLNKHVNGKNGKNGLPAKKDTQVEIGDPYDEYFVPVNEHRKYMRYVSID